MWFPFFVQLLQLSSVHTSMQKKSLFFNVIFRIRTRLLECHWTCNLLFIFVPSPGLLLLHVCFLFWLLCIQPAHSSTFRDYFRSSICHGGVTCSHAVNTETNVRRVSVERCPCSCRLVPVARNNSEALKTCILCVCKCLFVGSVQCESDDCGK